MFKQKPAIEDRRLGQFLTGDSVKNSPALTLEAIKIEKDQDFVIAYDKDFRFTLVGEMSKNNNSIVLTNIIKADDFREMDNSDLFQFIREQGD